MALKFMVVDDDPEVLNLIRSVVEPFGCEALTVADSREAAERVKRQKVDGVFLNAEMPGLDGYALTRCIRASPSNRTVPIAMLTDVHNADRMQEAFKAGATFFVGNPVDEETIQQLMNAMRGAMRREKRSYARLPVRVEAELRMGHERLKCITVNISERGMLIELGGELPVGAEADFAFRLPQLSEPVEGRARVVRKEAPNRAGLQFIGLSPKAGRVLRDFISATPKE